MHFVCNSDSLSVMIVEVLFPWRSSYLWLAFQLLLLMTELIHLDLDVTLKIPSLQMCEIGLLSSSHGIPTNYLINSPFIL